MAVNVGIQVLADGRVQGIGYRFFVRTRALAYGLVGFVRNLPDGRVEVVAVGERGMLEGLIGDLREGPPGSRVRECRVRWLENAGSFTDFSITY